MASQSSTIIKEIDISIFTEDHTEKYAIELKCPLNGQYPEQMYSFVKDIKFMEQLKDLGFVRTACVALVSGKDEASISLSGSYAIDWMDLNARSKFYIVEIE